jgi:flagellar hook assembly protein FlgD
MKSLVLAILSQNLQATYGNYPNPFQIGAQTTTLQFNLGSASTVSLIVYDLMGAQVATLLNGAALPAGLQSVTWDGKNDMGSYVLNGVYLAQLNVNGQKLLIKIAAVK